MTEKSKKDFVVDEIVPVHSTTYNEYLQSRKNNRRFISEPYFVFVDQALTIHPDNKNFTEDDTIAYHGEIMHALKKISEVNGNIKIVVAAHPRCQYDRSFWYPYDVYLGTTSSLVAHAEGVIGHFSTSLALAQVYGKKIFLLESSSEYFPFNTRVEHASLMLSATVVDMKDMRNIKEVNNENQVSMTDYLTLLPDSDVENNELLMNFFSKFDAPAR